MSGKHRSHRRGGSATSRATRIAVMAFSALTSCGVALLLALLVRLGN